MIIRSLLSIPRAATVDFGRSRGRDMAEIIVRAGSKPGAMMTARAEAMKTIPFREQNVEYVEQMEGNRFMNKWRVKITDEQSMGDMEN